jgi:putative hydrolase of the HAD superfamily
MPIQAIYFDIGGVLVRTDNRLPRQQLAARLTTTYENLSELVFGGEHGRRAQLGEITTEQQWAYVCQQVGWPIADWRNLESEFFRGDSLDTTLLDFVRALHRRYKTGIISNAFDDVRRVAMERWGADQVFDTMIFSAEVGIAKPDARIFHLALQALNVQPAEAIFVDDFAHNVEGARAVGMHAIRFRTPQQAMDELSAWLSDKD